jgi:virulence factor Mce-like protein
VRRLAPSIVLLAAAAIAAVVVVIATETSSSRYRVAAIFDTANGMVSGQQVKIAGAVVGTVDSVELRAGADGFKARIVMSVDHRFAPFRADAGCTILPEGLISENFVSCTPGRAPAPLPAGTGGLPTVPLAQTTVPFSLQDVLNVLSLPTDQRLSILISELGIGTAGRGQDINALLRRANPALQQSQRVLAIVDAQRAQLATAVAQTDQVLGSLAQRSTAVREFVDRAATVAQTTAAHSRAVSQAVARFPAMLAAVRPGLRALDRAATNATPLLGELRAAAPGLTQLTTTLPAFSRAGIPALRTLGAAAAAGRPAVRDAVGVVSRVRAVTGPLGALGSQLNQLLLSLRGDGGIEGLLRLTYTFATNTALYDNVSHIITFIASVAPECIAAQQGGFDLAGCAHKYNSPGAGEVPVNEPSCGPKSGAWFDQRCPPVPPGPFANQPLAGHAARARVQKLDNSALAGRRVDTRALRPLLSYLIR